jgi:phosphoribosylformylglycinamidine synthase subunit PurQ / glutaminase
MKFGVVVFPGSNCDEDMFYVLSEVMGQETVRLWHKDTDLQGCNFIVIPGGFSYGDYLRSGAIARFSPIMDSVIKHAENGGYLMGICNGFQILCEADLLPGTLLHNTGLKFICKNIHLTPASKRCIISAGLEEGRAYKIPIAHGEGNYFAPPATIKELEENGQIIFRYCDEEGGVTEDANPNGSLNNIAGVCNKAGNVFGMMPHPERASDYELGNLDGKDFFESILKNAGVELAG